MSGSAQDWGAALLLSVEPTDRALAGWGMFPGPENWLRGIAERAELAERACACGHDAEAHAHYRRGSDCSLCRCRRFRPSR